MDNTKPEEGCWIRGRGTAKLICSKCGMANHCVLTPYCCYCGNKNGSSIVPEPKRVYHKEAPCKCLICGEIFTDGRVMKLSNNPDCGVCFNCYEDKSQKLQVLL